MPTRFRIAQLLWAPARLGSAAVGTSVTTAAAVGMAALVVHLTMVMLYVTALRDPPPATAWQFAGEVVRGVAAAAVLGVLFVYFARVIGHTAYNERTALSFKILLLSPVTMLLPVALYAALLLLAIALVPERWSDQPAVALGQMVLAALGSCWWAPVLFLMWLWLWQRAARLVERMTPAGWPVLCQRCGYDLRGTLAAERRECPECGEPIPPHAVSAALSDTQ